MKKQSPRNHNSSSSFNSNSNSTAKHGVYRNHQREEKNRNKSVLDLIKAALKVFTCSGGEPEPHGQPRETVSSFSTDNSSVSNTQFKYSGSSRSSRASVGQVGAADFSFEEIYKATKNFSPANIIGDGGFGTVYKGKLKDGSLIAVKRAKKNNYERGSSTEFKNEILTLSKIEHLNLVKFLGYLEHGDERIILVEYVGNGNLREHLDGIHGNELEIGERLDIAIDVAHAVTYLHTYAETPVIHRDIKASNILITQKFRAKVADFGFARMVVEDPEATHISTQVKGTAGYLDPEYLKTYQLTEKSDVYSFGVLLVELVTGRQPIEPKRPQNDRVTIKWAMHRLKGGEVVLAMDPKLRRTPASLFVVEKVLKLARQCIAPTRQSRPSMKKCAEILWRIRKDFNELSLPNPASTSNYSVQVPQIDARKNRHEFFGIDEDSETYRFRSA